MAKMGARRLIPLSEINAADVVTAITRKSRPFQLFGFELLEAKPGYLRLAMRVREEMLGAHDLCEGGYIFSLADLACAFACITRNEMAVTQSAHITFVSPARKGERLVAEATEVFRTRKNGTYDVVVHAEDGRLVGLLRGQCALLGSPVLSEAAAEPGTK